ncbi:MAG: cation-translocating P-type ATPase, partial [Clostridia bacterium]|nr:cation-translocating P-type ATPase [Clostridia bacterium]
MKKKNGTNNSKISYHSKTIDLALNSTKSSILGLTSEEAEARLQKYGENVLPQKKPKSFIIMLLQEFLNPIVLILLVAMAFSLVVNEWIDAAVIFGIVMIDAVIGAIQEKRAQHVAKSLSSMIKVKTKVLRDNTKVEIESKNLVVGDIVFLESGDKISADM